MRANLIIFILLLFVIGCGVNSRSNRVTRSGQNKQMPIESKSVEFVFNPDIFKDYGWAMPEMNSALISFSNNKASVIIDDVNYDVVLENDTMIFSHGEQSFKGIKMKSKNDCYYNAKELKFKEESVSYWVTTWRTEFYQQSVIRYRTESRMQTQTINGRTSYYSTSVQVPYTAYEQRTRQVPESKWVTKKKYVYDIPSYTVFSIDIDHQRWLVYEIEKDNQKQYLLQNTSYVFAQDKKKVNYVLIDINANGKYTDDVDKVLFNTWNPYNKDAKYTPMDVFRENHWYTVDYLENVMFLTVEVNKQTKQLKFDAENSKYTKSKGIGAIILSKLNKDCRVIINGTEYRRKIKDGKVMYKSEYGKFLLEIVRDGYLSFEKIYVLDEIKSSILVQYEPTAEAGKLEIKNIYADNFTVHIRNSSGYEKTFFNKRVMSLPVGNNLIVIDNKGALLEMEVEVKKSATAILDYEAEMKKLVKDVEVKETEASEDGK